ncbi:hypothetical protein CspeluHIS016_0900340 [Cutaneotrichosporon spelunceum]|uniref:Cytochrome b561 domain-containing protein n=1 Tax=Cutaneotrichosporon spelunceum TaxID=1672016 RepID=A0AAD3U0G5_9TREE|nr:hypothetical protein CspeluHIS016_0900340 [Cutaneotrichosporon spelunceum]
MNVLLAVLAINPYLPSSTTMRRLALLALLLHSANAQYGYGPYTPTTTTTAGATSTSKASSGSSEGSESSEYGIQISRHSVVVAHVTCGALATLLLLPVGVMAARAPRAFTSKRWWFPLHACTQVLGLALVLAAFGIAWAHFAVHTLNTPHRKVAVAFFAIIITQAALGILTHAFGGPRRGVLNYIHWVFGLCAIGVGWAVAWLGITNEWEYRMHGKPAYGYRVGWGVVIGFWILMYAVGLTLLPRQLKRERADAAAAAAAGEHGNETETEVAALHPPKSQSN